MKKMIFIFISFSLYSQTNVEVLKYDFSNLWLTSEISIKTSKVKKQEALGFIGQDYKRFFIKFLWIEKDSQNPKQYLVRGKIMFNDRKTNISGTIVINSNTSGGNCSIITGEYYFQEGPNYELITAIYKGTFISKYTLKNDKIEYCTNYFGNDDFSNNQFSGTREDRLKPKIETCNWGDYRIPNCSDLDIGTGEFAPNEKYVKNGWINYVLDHRIPSCFIEGDSKRTPGVYEWWKE